MNTLPSESYARSRSDAYGASFAGVNRPTRRIGSRTDFPSVSPHAAPVSCEGGLFFLTSGDGPGFLASFGWLSSALGGPRFYCAQKQLCDTMRRTSRCSQ